MRKLKTKRTIVNIMIITLIAMIIVIWLGIRLIKPVLIELGFELLASFNDIYLLFFPLSLTVGWMFVWAVHHRIWHGLGYAIAHAGIERRLRRQLADAYFINSREFDGAMKDLPRILIMFDDNKKRDSGIIKIENTVQFQSKLEGANIASALSSNKYHFVLEGQTLSLDSRFYVYEFIDTQVFEQQVFRTLSEYIEWTQVTTDDYQIRVDNRTTVDLTHMGISGITGAGKSFFLQALVEQVLSKPVKHQMFIIDPKRSDLYQLARRNLPEDQYSDKQGAIALLQRFKVLMAERIQVFDGILAQNPNSTYRDAGLPAMILLVDELGSLREDWKLLSKTERETADTVLSDVAFLGRQLNAFLWLASQQISANTLPTSVRDQLIYRCVLGPSEDTTYRVMFAPSVTIQDFKLGPGQGYFSYPGISTTQNPKLVSLPYCLFLKGQYWATERAKPAKLPQLGYGNNPSSEMNKKDEIRLWSKEKTRKECD